MFASLRPTLHINSLPRFASPHGNPFLKSRSRFGLTTQYMESPGQDAFGVPPKLNRSCELCRVRKIRCSPRASIPGSRCSRCIERNLVCEYKPASKRSRQRIAHRIKELENKLEALIPLVSQVEEDATGVYHGVATDLSKDTFRSSLDPTLSILSSHTGTTSNRPESPVATAPDLNSLSASEEVSLYNYFRDELLPHYPVIHIPMSNNYNTIRDKKPLLYHAMVTASSAAMQPMIAPMLYRSLEQTLAQAAMVDGQKSLDLVQALLISAIWAYPPSSFSELKFGRFAQMAADILMDLNILDELSQCLSQDGYLKIDSLGDEIPWLEKARTLLGCFLLCSRYFVPGWSDVLNVLTLAVSLLRFDAQASSHIHIRSVNASNFWKYLGMLLR